MGVVTHAAVGIRRGEYINRRISRIWVAHVAPTQRDGAARWQRRQQVGRDTANPQPCEVFEITRARDGAVGITVCKAIRIIAVRRGYIRRGRASLNLHIVHVIRPIIGVRCPAVKIIIRPKNALVRFTPKRNGGKGIARFSPLPDFVA